MYRILDCYFVPYCETEIKKIPPEELANLESVIDALFVFSLLWSVGATTDAAGREKFNLWIKAKAK